MKRFVPYVILCLCMVVSISASSADQALTLANPDTPGNPEGGFPDCICGTVFGAGPDDAGFCVRGGTPCAGNECAADGSCPAGSTCVVDSCCGVPTCGDDCNAECDNPGTCATFESCVGVPDIVCEDSLDYPVCDGICPPGLQCAADPTGTDRCLCEEPMAVDLVSLEATVVDGGIRVTWTTSSEVDNVGFRVMRVQDANSERAFSSARLDVMTPQIMAAAGSPLSGASYEYLDATPQHPGQVAHYYLEDVDFLGQAKLHGPVSVVVPEANGEKKTFARR